MFQTSSRHTLIEGVGSGCYINRKQQAVRQHSSGLSHQRKQEHVDSLFCPCDGGQVRYMDVTMVSALLAAALVFLFASSAVAKACRASSRSSSQLPV